ncbi:MAG: site-2 protease family protein [Candidatus Aenigmarchaeota archaeon]|nr:site-2 protease family protein [Candidatus Aenigmarchaeota archaeon]
MDYYTISVLVFVAILAVLVYLDRKKYKRESIFLLRKTKRGRGLIIRVGTKFPRAWKAVGFVAVVTGFIVSIFGLKMLFDNLINAIAARSLVPSLALILPSPTATPVFGYGYLAIPFWYWIICLALLALVHEGMHGIFSARENVRIKSLGFGILAVIPLAFVEPDEKQLEKKGVWPSLRVFAAGSFANFLLAALTFVIIVWMSNAIFIAAGVSFGAGGVPPYPAARIVVSDIQTVLGSPVNGTDDILGKAEPLGENDTIELNTVNETFFLRKHLLVEQLNGSPDTIVAFADYPAARVGLEGVIIGIDDKKISDTLDLSMAMEDAGPDRQITVRTKVGDEERTFTIQTVTKQIPSGYSPDSLDPLFAAFEHIIPGSIEFYHSAGEAWSGVVGQRTGITWTYIQYRIAMWEWVSENYPMLEERAGRQVAHWESRLESYPRPGFIGVTGVLPNFELMQSLEPYRQPLEFVQGLLFFLFLINLGVGIVNLLPVKPLDGGRMWDVVFKRYIPEHAGWLMRALGALTFLLLVANFIPFGAIL